MSNILPRDTQRDVWRMYRARFIVTGSLIAIVTAFFAGIALLPMYLALHASDESLSASSQSKNDRGQGDRAEVGRAQLLISALAPMVTSTTSPSQAIGIALRLRPKGVVVDRILYSSGTSKEIVITGDSATREGIHAYQQALQSDRHFKNATVPISDLAGTKSGEFSVTLTGAF